MPGQTTTLVAAGRRAARGVGRRAALGAVASFLFCAALDGTARAAPRGDRRLLLYNPHTTEHFNDVYWCDGRYVPDSLTHINWLMRDYHRDVVAPIDLDLVDLLHAIAQRLETERPLRILSGFRTAATNRLLQREGLAPAAHSEHLRAKAADICIDRVPLKHLRRAALSFRAGGVGTYWQDHFIHVDVGPVRSW